MSARSVELVDVVSRYAAGYYPMYSPWDRFYWERLPVRAVLRLSQETVRRARRIGRRAEPRFEIRYSTALDQVLDALSDEHVKAHTWVRAEVVHLYQALFRAGLLRTIEAWQLPGSGRSAAGASPQGGAGMGGPERLVGGLLGIVLPGTFIAETMFGLVPEASKACLCRLVKDCAAAGFAMIDVQTPHDLDEYGLAIADEPEPGKTPHPCIRLGEVHLPLRAFLRDMAGAWESSFPGDVQAWVQLAPRLAEEVRIDTTLPKFAALARFLRQTSPPH